MIVQTLIQQDRTDKVLPLLLDLLKDDSNEDRRILGLQILNTICADLGEHVCANYLIYEIVSLQEDPLYKVRKETCKNMVGLCSVVSTDVFLGVLLPVFKKLCTDHIWGVRKQAAEVLASICAVAPDDTKTVLLDIFKKFTKDQSKWVKQAATQCLGPFLVAFADSSQTGLLLDFYLSTVADLYSRKSIGTQAI
jgi:serine/threonine-protein phosphatase 4 regulatory subunit 1